MIKSIPLKNLRPGNVKINNPPLDMNSRREYVNPKSTLQNLHSLSLKVNRYFTDVDGKLIDKANAALIASGMVVDYPVFMLGQWDKQSGYKAGLSILAPQGSAKYLLTFVNGYGMTSNNILTPYSGVNALQPLLKLGDIVQVYVNDLNSPAYFCFIVQSGNATGLASLLDNMGTQQNDNRLMKLFCYEINLVQSLQVQYTFQWHFVHVDNLGNPKDNQVTYNMFDNPFRVQPNVLTFSTEFIFNQYIGVYTYLSSNLDSMSVNFNFRIIE